MNNLVKINSVEHLTAMVKAIVPRSFEKTFGGLSTDEVVAGFTFCVIGLTQTELNTGLAKVREMGFCPDPAMFAKWCKGIDGFDNTDHIADSYIGKTGALSNILAWIENNKNPISVAEKQAYDKTMHLFEQANYNHQVIITAHTAFKEHYEMIVRELVANKIQCEHYIAPISIEQKQPQPAQQEFASDEFVNALFKKHGFKGLSKLNKMEAIA